MYIFRRNMKIQYLLILLIVLFTSCTDKKTPSEQNPSPMEEYIRLHERVDAYDCAGIRLKLDHILAHSIDVFIPEHLIEGDSADLVIHFHGNSNVTEWAACSNKGKRVVVTINLGSGSGKYEHPFLDLKLFSVLLMEIRSILKDHNLILHQTFLSGFSAGYGSLRAILNDPANHKNVDGILLLDGLHTDYVPDGVVLSKGGILNTSKLQPFLDFAELAAQGKKKLLFTHSSIFPGTFASTTECADYLIQKLGLSRTPVLRQGPLGMQQVGLTSKGGLTILAFAGNTAPDHVDHLHGFYYFIGLMLQ